MDLAEQLQSEDMSKLQTRERNAVSIMERFPGTPDAQRAEQLLELISNERDRRSIPGNIETFLHEYPGGFDDALFRRKERDDKLAASEACRELLTAEAFAQVVAGEDPAPLVGAVKRVIGMTNLIQGSFEKPKLYGALQDPRHTLPLLREIGLLLHGPGDAAARLEAFSDHLGTIGLRKWTYGTYLLFLSDPDRCMFVKPEGLKKALEITGYPLVYDATPSAHLYRQVLEFAAWIRSRLVQSGHPQLAPEDMIDVQSFIWHMAPTGKFARP